MSCSWWRDRDSNRDREQSLRLSATRTRRCPPAKTSIRARHERPTITVSGARRPRPAVDAKTMCTNHNPHPDPPMRARARACVRVLCRTVVTLRLGYRARPVIAYTSSLPRSRRRTDYRTSYRARRAATGVDRHSFSHSNRHPTDCRELSHETQALPGTRARVACGAATVGPRAAWTLVRCPARPFRVAARILRPWHRHTDSCIAPWTGSRPRTCRGRRSRHAELGAQ